MVHPDHLDSLEVLVKLEPLDTRDTLVPLVNPD